MPKVVGASISVVSASNITHSCKGTNYKAAYNRVQTYSTHSAHKEPVSQLDISHSWKLGAEHNNMLHLSLSYARSQSGFSLHPGPNFHKREKRTRTILAVCTSV